MPFFAIWVGLSVVGRARQAETPAGAPTGSPVGSALFANFDAALRALDECLEVHGGKDWFTEGTYRLHFSGQHQFQAHLAKPWAYLDSPVEGRLIYSGPQRAFRDAFTFSGVRPMESWSILTPHVGVALAAGAREPHLLEGAELDKSWSTARELLPNSFLAAAAESANTLALLRGQGPNSSDVVLQYQSPGGARRILIIDGETHHLERVEQLAHWEGKGDRLDWWEFSDYAQFDGRAIPRRVRSHIEAETTQEDLDLALDDVEIGSAVEAAEFELPERYRADFAGFEVSPVAPQPAAVHDHHALGHGVYVLDLEEVNGRCILVEFKDHLAVYESGGSSPVGQQVLETAHALFPNKPVRYLAMSHHHRISASGIRPYVQAGVTLLATPGNVEYLRDLAKRPYRLKPDAQERDSKEPSIEVIDTLRVLEDETQRLELHAFGDSTHTDEYVFAYAPRLRLGVVGDLLYMPKSPETQPAGPRARAVHGLILRLGLRVDYITQTWPLEENYAMAPFELLATQVRLYDERDSASK